MLIKQKNKVFRNKKVKYGVAQPLIAKNEIKKGPNIKVIKKRK